MRSRRSRQSQKLSHTQTSVPCGTLNEDISILSGEGKTSDSRETAPEELVLSTNEDNSLVSAEGKTSSVVTNSPVEEETFKTCRTGRSIRPPARFKDYKLEFLYQF